MNCFFDFISGITKFIALHSDNINSWPLIYNPHFCSL